MVCVPLNEKTDRHERSNDDQSRTQEDDLGSVKMVYFMKERRANSNRQDNIAADVNQHVNLAVSRVCPVKPRCKVKKNELHERCHE